MTPFDVTTDKSGLDSDFRDKSRKYLLEEEMIVVKDGCYGDLGSGAPGDEVCGARTEYIVYTYVIRSTALCIISA